MNRKLLLAIIFFLIGEGIYSQPRNFPPFNPFKLEYNVIKSGEDSYKLYLSVRIPFKDLIFIKNENSYDSGAEFFCEIFKDGNLVDRKSANEAASVSTYEETSDDIRNIQFLLTFDISGGIYSVKPFIERANTNSKFPLQEIPIDLKTLPEKRIRPVVVEKLTGSNAYSLVNMSNNIPYQFGNIYLMVPVADSLKNFHVKIQQNNTELKDTLINSVVKNSYRLLIHSNQIVINPSNENNGGFSYIFLKLPDAAEEGEIQVIVQSAKRSLFNMLVVWYAKPFILNDLDASIKLFKIVGGESSAESIMNIPDELKYKSLKEEWIKKTGLEKSQALNLFKEFYSRADYAMKNYSYGGRRNGIDSDRGQIYIKFGKPDKIDRQYNSKYEIVEIWTYSNLNKEFIFMATSGDGNYILRR